MTLLYLLNVPGTYQHIMSKVQQPNSSKVRSILHEYTSQFTSTPTGELFCKFYDCLVKNYERFMVEAHGRSGKHQRGWFHETESSQKKFF